MVTQMQKLHTALECGTLVACDVIFKQMGPFQGKNIIFRILDVQMHFDVYGQDKKIVQIIAL